jgi:hypothetical protein
MKITESGLRKIIREEIEMNDKPPGWVPPPSGWMWNVKTQSYDRRGDTVMWDPHAGRTSGEGSWVVVTGDGQFGPINVESPEDGFFEADQP